MQQRRRHRDRRRGETSLSTSTRARGRESIAGGFANTPKGQVKKTAGYVSFKAAKNDALEDVAEATVASRYWLVAQCLAAGPRGHGRTRFPFKGPLRTALSRMS